MGVLAQNAINSFIVSSANYIQQFVSLLGGEVEVIQCRLSAEKNKVIKENGKRIHSPSLADS